MSTGTDTTTGEVAAGTGTTAPQSVDVIQPPGWWWRRPWGRVLLVLAGLAVAAVVVGVVVTQSDAGPTARVLGPGGRSLSDVPASATVERWSLDLGLKDRVAVIGDRVVVADEPFPDAADRRPGPARAPPPQSPGAVGDTTAGGCPVRGVDADGRTVEPAEATDSTRESRGSTFGVDANDGSVLWERNGGYVEPGPGPDSVLVQQPSGGCELVASRSGEVLLASDEGFCVWLDADRLAVQVGDGWEVRGMDQSTVATFAGPQPPAATDDLLVGVDADGEVVARNAAGDVEWRRSTDVIDGGVRAVPGTGFLVSAYDQEADAMRSELLDTRGRQLPREQEDPLEAALYLEFDGRRLGLQIAHDQGGDRLTIRDLDDGTELATEELDPSAVSSWGALTSRGLLTSDRTANTLTLRAWPDLAETWSVDLPPGMVLDDQEPPPVVQSTATGLVVVTPTDEGAVLHAYS